jgi:hypothetical protein
MGDKMRRKQPSAQSLRHYRICLEFPHDLSIFISLDPVPGKALAARDAVEAAWSRTGNWVGHGTSLAPGGECDVQVLFRTPEEVAAARRAAVEILRAAGIDRFRFGEHTSSPEGCANLYGIRAEDLLREGGV